MIVQNLSISSNPENLRLVEKFAEEVCDYYNITDLYYGNILIALTEAAANAIIHGNNNDESKQVDITVQFVKGGLLFTVEDEGNGFDFESIPDPIEAEEEIISGRGIFVMKTLSDKIEFEKNGSRVVMMFEIQGLEDERTQRRINKMSKYSNLKPHKHLTPEAN
jgi:serine/threonine-protein kinase RsbW